jgi:NTP pyrophosphatase (non-canonical NTP hydrolase)
LKNYLGPTLISAIESEITNARNKFPQNRYLTVALMEEVGELAKAELHGEPVARIRNEAIQVIAVAVRIIQEGDASLQYLDEEARQK